ncbi:MAG: Re/Si-specific NAD(P)(+) transhydrogenase subunit alpha [Micropepsaceae bacterium]
MKIGIPKERRANETRVAATPETVKKFKALGVDILVESGAGAAAHFADADYAGAGASMVSASEALGSDVVLKVQRPTTDELKMIGKGSMLAAILAPYAEKAMIPQYAAAGVNTFAMEFMPRITRAQSMDVLSSQSNLAGYKSVIDAAALFGRAFPMMMTAAGTIAAARVLVMGVGVAGLQAIATAKRLGAIVSATDVRLATKEQVKSLGGTFVAIEDEETKQAETAGGYAREMSDAYKHKQAALIAETIRKQDVVITTALIPGRPAPVLVTEDMVRSMKPGSIIIDLAAEQGGNCPLTKAGETIEVNGVKIVGAVNLAGHLAADASALYSRNLFNFLSPMIDKATKTLKVDWNDEIIKGTCLTRDGEVVHAAVKA